MFLCLFIRIFAAYNGTEPMPKETNIKHNSLNISALPPPIGGGKDSDYTYSKTLAKLLRRFVRIAVPDQDQVYFSDIEMLDTLMLCDSITGTAEKCKLSASYVSTRIAAILKQLDQRVSEWETIKALYAEEKQISDMEGYLEKLRQRKAELQSQINEETTIVRGMTMTYAEKRVRDNQIYLRECKYKKK